MVRYFLVCVFLLACVVPAWSADEVRAPAITAAAAAPAATNKAAARSDELFGRGSLTIRQRRELGLTIPAIAKTLRQLQAEGSLEPGMSRSEMAALVLDRMSAENPAYAAEGIDLDGILAFLEAILPLILQIIAIFS